MARKPAFQIDLANNARGALEAQPFLEALDNAKTYHTHNHLRPALGIYNVSTHRVLQKVCQLSQKLEGYIRAGLQDPGYEHRSELSQGLIDYIELSLYAAAEHVDDLENIVRYFYRTNHEMKSSNIYKTFHKKIKERKWFLSGITNHIKHFQNRIRLYYLEYEHGGNKGVLEGYIVESVTNGVVGPSEVFHTGNHSIFSTTSLVWEIIVFILCSSRALRDFLESGNYSSDGPACTSTMLTDAVIAAARLPLYNLDDVHPFSNTTIRISSSEHVCEKMRSHIYGSILDRWKRDGQITFGRHGAAFAGDGVTKTFNMLISPSNVGLQHWG